MNNWDVIVVGAGPAGSALARRLSPENRVLLLDRQAGDTPERPRIGESLPGAARVLLQRLGIFESFLAAGHAERGAAVSTWDTEERVYFDPLRDPNGPGWHLDRRRFDAGLREAAIAAGAKLLEIQGRLQIERLGDGWEIVLENSGEQHQAPILVDATGRNAAVARQLGIPRQAEDDLICLYAHLPAKEDDEDQCTRICADRNGWWYSVRVPAGQRVLALHLESEDPELQKLRNPDALLTKAKTQPLLAEVLNGYEPAPVHARPAASVHLDFERIAKTPGFFAIGDAMLSFDPIASQGLFHALASAESAARAIQQPPAEREPARGAFLAEMQAVQARYRQHLLATYAGVLRYRNEPFWSRRLGIERGQYRT